MDFIACWFCCQNENVNYPYFLNVTLSKGRQKQPPKSIPMLSRRSLNIAVLCLVTISSILYIILMNNMSAVAPPKHDRAEFRSNLNSCCRGFETAIVSQAKMPVGTVLHYDGDNTEQKVTPDIFKTFIKQQPFSKTMFKTCAVVGNGGILKDSGCGETIDSAQFVMRANLPPLDDTYAKDVGVRTDVVTANPTILIKYNSLLDLESKQKFVEAVKSYGEAHIILPAFSFSFNTLVSTRAAQTLQDFRSPARAVFWNPEYLRNLSRFWAAKGLKPRRLTTGIMLASLALELCAQVHLYGFWPFSQHPNGHTLTHHYYDNIRFNSFFHDMPKEHQLLSELFEQDLQVGACPAIGRV
ncbi:alpha-2,8-sialyltransferase 8E-like isoform X1 [Phycodurus eques]|uniref:alpha-2,8-sialyltransferase 8E-like isoform X1 n=2 Tax=Phycodurus eques TaxID=693459 RepID=UPI002ACDC1D3|nr:alpha-2,8-sialyltransferase 8E-like isoform X1 [Phycodurus eques]